MCLGYIVPFMEPSISPSSIMDSTTVGRAPKAPSPLLWRRPKAASIMVDGEINGSIYGTIYPSKMVPETIILPEELLILAEGLLQNLSPQTELAMRGSNGVD